jgi:hypothetical protein
MNKIVNRILMASAGASLLLGGIAFAAGSAPATAPGLNKLQCFDGTTDGGFGGTCTLNSMGAKGSATLSLTSSNPNGDYAGAYTLESKLYGTLLTNVTQLSYQYSGTIAPQPGNLSLNIPISLGGGSTTDAYAFIDAYYCPGTGGSVDVIHDASCGIYYNGSVFYPNWAAFVAAYPGASIATDNYAFIIAERTPSELSAVWTVNNVKFGKGGK